MSLPVIVRPAAERDLLEAQRWYEAQRAGLGGEFRAEIDGVLRLINEWPLGFPEVHRGIRRAVLRRFPYLVYYRVEPKRALVIAALHSSRDPRLIRRRLL